MSKLSACCLNEFCQFFFIFLPLSGTGHYLSQGGGGGGGGGWGWDLGLNKVKFSRSPTLNVISLR